MRYTIPTFLALIFAFLFVFASSSYAQTSTSSPSATVTPKPAAQTVEYELPYPGMLPDNPLYNLKALRDRIIEFLISNPYKKAEFYLLSSDKRFNSGYYLVMKDKDDMGVLYISKSNNYMNMGISEAYKAKEEGTQILQKMKLSIKKHQQLIDDIEEKVDQKNKTKLKYESERLGKMSSLIK